MPADRDQALAALIQRVAALEEQGITSRVEQAQALGMPLRTYMRRRAALGIQDRPTLSRWIPWSGRIAREHHNDPTLRKLRYLAAAADCRPTQYEMKRAQAVRWARGLVEDGLDITYSREIGFQVAAADPGDWVLKRVLDAAMKYLSGHPDVT
ncbi:hypothetical protein GCM10010116_26220 [Microbispora rosea subsp. aerata]|nr:hypothetical protein [Microbispora rosea]GGO13017.1 hypothetical protein GCM10010116_26220 [Microbispora rosea subsp. aerata]GIH58430.1 hypothetical protein Mro02_53440 [Microbispora rosea subsp. aerata]GLJ85158.1 hypothetical protein GCM10017588_38860 [Microbispora rosea subsp. aerata]